jgi:3-oxoadipate enol-lactonase
MPTVATQFGALGVAEQGSGGTPIIFLHGVGSDKSVWWPQLQHFGSARRALAFDYPGYGDSDPAAPGTSRDHYAAAILAAMDALGIAKAHVCGLSLGGVVAIAMHAAAPQRCASIVIADSFAVHPDGRGIYERSLAASKDMRTMAQARVEVLLAQPADRGLRAQLVETMARIDPAAFRIGAEAVWLADQRERLPGIRVPALVIVGGEDKVTPPDLSRQLADAIAGAELRILAGAGHLANLEKADEFNALLEAFLRKAEAR